MDLNGYKEIRDAYRTISESLADAPAANTPAAAAPDAKDAFPKDRVERAKKQASPKSAASVKKEEVEISEAEGMHRDAKTGEVVKKAEIGKTYYPNTPKQKTSVKKKPDAFGGRFNKEEAELDTFDIILEYLMGRGFPQEDAMQLMATMEDERREKITAEAVSWDKYGRPKSKEGKAKAARAQAEMRAKDKAAGRDRYGYKTGYAKKTWDE